MDIDFFITALIFSGLGCLKYSLTRRVLKKRFIPFHCCYCGLAGIAILTSFSCLSYVIGDGRDLVESSATTAACILAGVIIILIRAKTTISTLSHEVE